MTSTARTDLSPDAIFVDGALSPGAGEAFTVIDPSTENTLAHLTGAGRSDVDAAVAAAGAAFPAWSSAEPTTRAAALRRLADALEARGEEIAHTVSRQNGMPIAVSSSIEAGFGPLLLRMYADLAADAVGAQTRPGALGGQVDVVRRPMGVVAAIVPWNYPQTLAMSKIAPALAAGNTVVVKPSPETTLDSLILAQCLTEAAIPPGIVNIVPGGRDTGAYLVSHPGIARVAFTGSTAAGRSVAQACAALLRPVSLELGGKSAAIILDDVDLAGSAEQLFAATLLNNGQTCFVGTRILAPASRYDEVVDFFVALTSGAVIGDAVDPATQIGPLVSSRQRERVEGFVQRGIADGARLAAGGRRPDRPGWFVTPTVLADVDNSWEIAREEVFGPVLAVLSYDDDAHAVALANHSDYGLGGTVFSADPERARAVAGRVQTGTIGVNGYAPDPAAPFGGVKNSGLGREFGPEALDEYVELQSIYH